MSAMSKVLARVAGGIMTRTRQNKKADDDVKAAQSATEPAETGKSSETTVKKPSGSTSESEAPVAESLAATDNQYAISAYVAEEEKLRQEREVESKETLQNFFHDDDGALDKNAFKKLDDLVHKTTAYCAFLSEQMAEEERKLTLPEEGGDENQVTRKRKAAPAKGNNVKRAKTSTPTEIMLPLIKGELRPYQLQGVRWMISLYNNGLNGILGDQMGLGKTIQTIGFLSYLKAKDMNGPYMIIGPLSTLANWISEFERFCPEFKTVLYHGSKKERADIRSKQFTMDKKGKAKPTFPVVVTSYEIVMADIKFLQKISWKFVIVDEGHRLKNWNCKLLRELRTLNCGNKMILSGTPLQNNLSELWSLLNFLLPEVFDNMGKFESWFNFDPSALDTGAASIVAKEQRHQVVSKLHQILKPFLLRRIKSDVENSLPAKKEIILYAPMTDLQKKYDKDLRDKTLNALLAKQQKDEGGRQPTSTKVNNLMMQMRKNCNHPDLITSAFTNDVMYPSSKELLEQCGKLQLLNRLLISLKAKGHRVLIFSQMTKMLDILDTFLEQEGHQSCRLDGGVKWQDRQKAMQDFKADSDLFVFLLSTRAGGLGINLTSADTVIIYDSDWNPHQDLQAMDRAHRIGQEHPVLVLRLATGNSVDGRMLKRANSKLMLERLVIRKGAFMSQEEQKSGADSLSNEELLELLKDNTGLKDKTQSGTPSDKVLESLLDRKHLIDGIKAPYKDSGVGYEVVQTPDGAGLLSSVQ